MQTHWMRYAWALVLLGILASVALIFSMLATRREPSAASPANDALIARSYQAFDNNELGGAIAAAEELLARDPRNIEALLAKAAALAQKGSLEFKENEYGPQAIAVAQQVLVLDAKNAEAWRIIGYANEIMQRYDAAHEAYEKTMALDPKNALVVSQDAHAWDLQGDMEKAEAGYRRALAVDPTIVSARAGLARVLVFQNKLDEALATYAQLSQEAGNIRQRAEAAYSAGQIAEMTGAYGSAEDHFRYATNIDPTYALGYVGLAGELFRQSLVIDLALSSETRTDLISESISNLKNAIALNPKQSLAYYQLAIEMTALGRAEDARIILNDLKVKIIDTDITLSSLAKQSMKKEVQGALDRMTGMKARSQL